MEESGLVQTNVPLDRTMLGWHVMKVMMTMMGSLSLIHPLMCPLFVVKIRGVGDTSNLMDD